MLEARARRHPYRHRRPARPRRAPLVPGARLSLHHRLPHPIPGLCRQRAPAAGRWFWRYIRWFHAPAQAVLVVDPDDRARAARARPARTRHWGRGVDLALFAPTPRRTPRWPACRARSSFMSAGSRSRRTSRRSYAPSIPAARSWSATARRSRSLQPRNFPTCISSARCIGDGARRRLSPRRCVRLPEPDRHVRPGDDRGAGLRHAGRGLSGRRPDRRAATTGVGAMDDDLDVAIASALGCDRAACAAYGRLQLGGKRPPVPRRARPARS